MTRVTEEKFLIKLYEVVKKLSVIAKTQSYRFKKEWEENLGSLKVKPHLIQQIETNEDKFLSDIDYRINILDIVRLSFEDGFNTIKILLSTLYNLYFSNEELFLKNYSERDQILLKYLVALEILGNLVQYNQLDNETVPLKYNILARGYYTMKLKELRDTEIQQTLTKVNLKIDLPELKEIMDEIAQDKIINKERKGRYYFYNIENDLKLSEEELATFFISCV